ncbi:MAG: hypothetical protein JXB03_06530 [Spirochaetales bacterium]|nr:hypothetical protein [Spirochaetales bacterium]
MFKSGKNRLDRDEIEQAKEKILEEYDHLIVRYMKPVSLKNAFLDRYLGAMRVRMDMDQFLHAEMTAVKELSRREETKEEELRAAKARRSERRKTKTEGFADRIIEENRQRIDKYPDLEFHSDASVEVKKMAGVLKFIDDEYWPAVDDILRRSSATLYSNSRLALEKSIYELATAKVGSASNRLSVYTTILGRFPRDYRALEREGQLYILSGAHFLHNLLTELAKMKESNNLDNDELIFVENVSEYVHNVIVDFRLVDLKPK